MEGAGYGSSSLGRLSDSSLTGTRREAPFTNRFGRVPRSITWGSSPTTRVPGFGKRVPPVRSSPRSSRTGPTGSSLCGTRMVSGSGSSGRLIRGGAGRRNEPHEILDDRCRSTSSEDPTHSVVRRVMESAALGRTGNGFLRARPATFHRVRTQSLGSPPISEETSEEEGGDEIRESRHRSRGSPPLHLQPTPTTGMLGPAYALRRRSPRRPPLR